MSNLLLADDDEELAKMLADYLQAEGFCVSLAHDGEQALHKALEGSYDLMILDIMMPKMNGLDVLRQLRQQSTLPVIMLTARGDDVDSIVGLELGADDYLGKPASARMLSARIRAVLRRFAAPDSVSARHAPALVLDDLHIHQASRTAVLNGRSIALTSTEFSVLASLAGAAGKIVSKQVLCESALGRPLERYDRSIDMHVSSLRKKLGVLHNGQERIKTVRGQGYQYVVAGEISS